jgi:hypothetical protein
MGQPILPRMAGPHSQAPSPAAASAQGAPAQAQASAGGQAQASTTQAQNPAAGQASDAAPERPLSWREKLFRRGGKKTAADYAPSSVRAAVPAPGSVDAAAQAAQTAQGGTAPAPVAQTQPAPTQGQAPDLAAENARLRAELAAARAPQVQPAAQTQPEPAKRDPRAQPFESAAAEYLGEGANADLVARAAAALHQYTAYRHQAEHDPDPTAKANAAHRAQRYHDQLESLRGQAAHDRELAELRTRLDNYEKPRVDVPAQTARLFAPEKAETMARYFHRLAHALANGIAKREVIEARIAKLDAAQDLGAWQDATVGVLADLDELFPDPPVPQTQPAAAQPAAGQPPANLAATAPREGAGATTARDPAQMSDSERRARLADRWKSRGPIQGAFKTGHRRGAQTQGQTN